MKIFVHFMYDKLNSFVSFGHSFICVDGILFQYS
jgi:hypothetical protein